MNNLLKVLPLGTGAIASILAFSNPTQEVYAEYLAWYIRDDFCKETQLETFEKAGCYSSRSIALRVSKKSEVIPD